MISVLKKIFGGTKHDKDVQSLKPLVLQINEEYARLSSLTDEQLRSKTHEFKALIQSRTAPLQEELSGLREQLASQDLNHDESLSIHDRIKEIGSEEFAIIQDTLDEILPEAFAVVKETCRRLTEKTHSYDVVGQHHVWAMIPYDVQLIGGIVIHQGKISEMATGEGKTLVAVSPMYLNALSGKGVHLVTVNDYLAKRDSEWMKPVFDFLDIRIGCIQSNMQPHQRHAEYSADITYGTNNEFGFDYLRDNMVSEAEDMVQRPHFFAIVDEVDSVLIDEARTPLIISGPVSHSNDQQYDQLNPRVRRLVDAQNRLINTIVNDAEKLLQSQDKESKIQAGINLLRAYRGMPKQKKLSKLLQEPEFQKLMRDTELEYLREQGTKMSIIDEEIFYTIDEKNHQIDITEKGRELLTKVGEDPEMFVIPDITGELSMVEGTAGLTADEKQSQKDELIRRYSMRSDIIHTVHQLLRAYSLYDRDVEYVVDGGKIKIVDEFTGRILDGRRYSDGLHQAIEAKEGVTVEADTQTYATITLQNYFRLYRKLAGMTGTAETEAGEFDKIYNLDVVVIPTNREVVRKDLDDLIFRTKKEKFNAVIDEIQKLVKDGRAVLVGTTSVEVSELLSKMLKRLNVDHRVLNAKQHQHEAEIVAEAGKKGKVTIATNMAGRGTDIKLDADVKANGGLAIIGTERHDARRIDRQLRGRAGRQGDPGSSQFFLSLEDNLMRLFGGERIASVMQTFKVPEGEPIQAGMVTKSVEKAQKKVEENNFAIRKRLIEYDNVMNQQREAIYSMRRVVIQGERMKGEVTEFMEQLAGYWYDQYHEEQHIEGLKDQVRTHMLCEVEISEQEFRTMKADDCIDRIVTVAKEFLERKEQQFGTEFMAGLERFAFLRAIDDKWREHLGVMDELKEGIHLRAYGQKDPLLEYKGEALNAFQNLFVEIQKETITAVFRFYPQPVHAPNAQPIRPQEGALNHKNVNVMNSPSLSFMGQSNKRTSTTAGMRAIKPEIDDYGHESQDRESSNPGHTVRNSDPKVGRNDPCPCGSGKKYKQCHGQHA
ncbi:MAG: preprotein translocase subunit SecA [Ignavibacteria bacterium]|jgi:preprotein translocase subunit SecA